MPPHSNEKPSVLQVVMPEGMKKDIEKKAQSEGISINSFVLGLLMDGLLTREAWCKVIFSAILYGRKHNYRVKQDIMFSYVMIGRQVRKK